jgi:hypothetical protein
MGELNSLVGMDSPMFVEILWVQRNNDWANATTKAESFYCKTGMIMLDGLRHLDMEVAMFTVSRGKGKGKFLKIMLTGEDYDIFEPSMTYTEHNTFRTMSLHFNKTASKTCGGCKYREYGICTNKERRIGIPTDGIPMDEDKPSCTLWIRR